MLAISGQYKLVYPEPPHSRNIFGCWSGYINWENQTSVNHGVTGGQDIKIPYTRVLHVAANLFAPGNNSSSKSFYQA